MRTKLGFKLPANQLHHFYFSSTSSGNTHQYPENQERPRILCTHIRTSHLPAQQRHVSVHVYTSVGRIFCQSSQSPLSHTYIPKPHELTHSLTHAHHASRARPPVHDDPHPPDARPSPPRPTCPSCSARRAPFLARCVLGPAE
ncbi:hypothetical protein BDW22DRAFT_538581 [Trametopsis cervina]|nr:hypothetical protein BDW22DRAFT_538581 [Trametopsis cervina]